MPQKRHIKKTNPNRAVPVFVHPSVINFNISDNDSYKQVLSLYNPYEFALTFQIFCNAPTRFTVNNHCGPIKPRCVVDVVVRHLDPSLNNVRNLNDKLRVEFCEDGYRDVIGRKDVPLYLIEQVQVESPSEVEKFESLKGTNKNPPVSEDRSQYLPPNIPPGPSWMVVSATLVCVAGLMLPTEGELSTSSHYLPTYLHVQSSVKTVIGFVLGLLTSTIIRSM